MSKIRGRVKNLIYFDATALALQAGSALALNMVMLGALAGSGVLPLETISIRETIRDKSKKSFVEINLMAFDLGMKALAAS
jgi:indolepyruvate ferredoxin oxidoreductase, beta subunit